MLFVSPTTKPYGSQRSPRAACKCDSSNVTDGVSGPLQDGRYSAVTKWTLLSLITVACSSSAQPYSVGVLTATDTHHKPCDKLKRHRHKPHNHHKHLARPLCYYFSPHKFYFTTHHLSYTISGRDLCGVIPFDTS